MVKVAFFIPGDLSTRTGGYGYNRRILALLPSFGVEVSVVSLPELYPEPSARALAEATRLISMQNAGIALMFDGLAYGVLPMSVLENCGERIIALVHHPLFLEAGLDRERREALFRSEHDALALARSIIVTSATTRNIVSSEFAIPEDSIVVAEPGTDAAQRASGTANPLRLLTVGAVTPRKGYDLLVRALAPLVTLPWELKIVGPLDRDPAHTRYLMDTISCSGLGKRVELLGAVSDSMLSLAYDGADVFVMSSLFEGYGMVLAEAMARGLPIVCTTGGACAETVPDSAAVKVVPGDVTALTMAIQSLLTDSRLRFRLAEKSWEIGHKLPRWEDTAHVVAEAITAVGNERL